MSLVMKIEGLEEVSEAIETLSKRYPDKAGELLRKSGRNFRKEVVKRYRNETRGPGDSKRSLKKLSSIAVTPPRGFGAGQYVEVSAKSPHFHLVEHGHVQLNRKGEAIGYIQGKHIMREELKKFEEKIPDEALKMLDGLIKESKLQ